MKAELIARLEAAEVGSRELGRDILVALNVVREIEPCLFYGAGNEDVWHFGDAIEAEGLWHVLPDPSSSLDAALALAERVLPLGSWRIEREGSVFWAKIWWDREGKAGHKYADAKTPALALCTAILKAKSHEADS